MTKSLATRPMTVFGVSTKSRRSLTTATLFLLPAGAIYALFLLWPLWETARLSVHKWDGLTPERFIGLANYEALLDDRLFWNALSHTALWTVFGAVVPVVAALALAVLVEDGGIRGKQLFRSLFFIPQVMSIAVTAVIWAAIYQPTYGLLNNLLDAVGLGSLARPWLGDPEVALPAIIFIWAWHFTAFAFVVYVAGLQSLDRTLYDAARIDGAGPWRLFWYVTLPLLRRVHTVVISLAIISSLRPFAVVWATTQGGPYFSTDVLPVLIYRHGFVGDEIGYSAAISVILAALTLATTVFFLRLRERGEER